MKHLLVVEDDLHNRSLLSHYMTREGYRVIEARNGVEALALTEQQPIDLAIIDVMLRDENGHQIWDRLSEQYDIPVIVIATSSQLEEKEQTFIRGVDDFLIKPYEMAELLTRIKAVFRRYSYASSNEIRLNHVLIDRKNLEIFDGTKLFVIPLKEFELLAQLAQYPGRLFSREELIRLVWGLDYSGDERTVDVHIKRLRQRFSKYKESFIIQTVRGIGYKLELCSSYISH